MSDYKILFQRIGLVGLTNLLGSLSGIILLPILTKNLSIEAYGIWAQVIVTVGIFPSLIVLGLQNSMVRYIPSSTKDEIQEIFYSFFSIVIFSSFLLSLFIYSISEAIALNLFDGNISVVSILPPVIMLECSNNIFLNYFRATQQIKKHSVIFLAKIILNTVLVSFFVLNGEGIYGAIIGFFSSSAIIFLISGLFIISEIGFKIPHFKNIREYLSFGLPTLPGMLSISVVNSSDRYLIAFFMGASYVGYYSPGYTLGNIVSMFLAPLNFMLPMVLSRYYDENNLENVKTILSYSIKYFLLVSIPAVFGLSILSKNILTLLSTAEIASQGYLITPFVAVSMLFFGIFSIFRQIIILEKKTKIEANIWIIAAALNLGLNVLLIPYIGIIAAAVTTLIAFIIGLLVMLHYSLKYLKFYVNSFFILKTSLASVIMSLIIFILNPTNILDILITTLICVLIYFLILLLLRSFDENEIKFLKNIAKLDQ